MRNDFEEKKESGARGTHSQWGSKDVRSKQPMIVEIKAEFHMCLMEPCQGASCFETLPNSKTQQKEATLIKEF